MREKINQFFKIYGDGFLALIPIIMLAIFAYFK